MVVLAGEMFLTASTVFAGEAPVAEAPTEPAEAEPETSPEGQVAKDLSPEPAPMPVKPTQRPEIAGATQEPAARPRRAPPDPDTPAAAPRLGAGGELRLHGGMHSPVVGAAIAFDWAFTRASLGFGVDYAAWIDIASKKVSAGSIHVFGLVIHRVPLGRVNLRQRLGIGPAIALEPLGARTAGKTGLFFEVAPLGLEVQTRVQRLAVTLDAFSLAISAPVLGKEVLAVIQYRLALGLRF